ncbi:transforming growth factor beta receptor type 3 isoform X2 [Pseudorasbora parva]|uniref:transforming growth factor beta receptor type 3 isoform X2 n=1 Tax=Pseudorasbora parva TaxID=51549 RepID=UPI00351EC447
MMPWTAGALLCLLQAVVGTAVSSSELQCSMWPAGALHPVQAQLEHFEAGTGCAAREGGAKETHVISVGKASNKQVTVVLRSLTLSRPVNRPVILMLSSQHAVRWVLENEGLPPNINVLVQVSLNSTAESSGMSIRVTQVPSLPWRPRVLLRWILQRHATISSLTHTVRANRVYLRLGEDPSMPSECRLRSLFLSQNYLASEIQEQDIHGCRPSEELTETEVHIIRLWSSGSGLCGSLQVEVSVSLLPPVARSGYHRIVLILSSAVSVNWALVAPEVKGHIRVYSSNSVSLPYRPQAPDLRMTSTVTSDLHSTPDLLEWAHQNGFPKVTSYTEADLANRFVIKLREGSEVRPSEEQQDDIIMTDRSREAVSWQCEGGALSVAVDTQMLQISAVTSVTLRDRGCKAEFNGSHFLMVFPVISCGTAGEMDGANGRVHYTNTVFLWKQSPSVGLNNETDWEGLGETSPMAVHISCDSSLSTHASPADVIPSVRPEEALRLSPAAAPPWTARARAAPLLSMELFVTEAYERRSVGPCVLSAHERLYVQISVGSGAAEAVELQSCLVSPLSDPQAHSGWSIIRDSCPSDPSFTLPHTESQETTDSPESDQEERDADEEDEKTDRRNDRRLPRWGQTGGRSSHERARRFKRPDRPRGRRPEERRRRRREDDRESTNTLRFSFILRPVYNNSIQFLHCRLRLCGADEGPSGASTRICAQGPQIPALTHTPASQQCEDRNLSRPVLVTYAAGFLAPPPGKLAERSRQTPTHTDEGPVLVVVFAAFVLGLFLMGALWCIYTQTGRPDLTRRDGFIETAGQNNGFRNPLSLMEQTSSFHEPN